MRYVYIALWAVDCASTVDNYFALKLIGLRRNSTARLCSVMHEQGAYGNSSSDSSSTTHIVDRVARPNRGVILFSFPFVYDATAAPQLVVGAIVEHIKWFSLAWQ